MFSCWEWNDLDFCKKSCRSKQYFWSQKLYNRVAPFSLGYPIRFKYPHTFRAWLRRCLHTVCFGFLEQQFELDFVPVIALVGTGHRHVDRAFTQHAELGRANLALRPRLVDQAIHRVHLRPTLINKKFELMLRGRAKAYSSSCLHTVSLSSNFVATFTGVQLFDALVCKFPWT